MQYVPDGFILATKRCRVKWGRGRRRLFVSHATTQLQRRNGRGGIEQHVAQVERTRDEWHVAARRATLTDRIKRCLHHTIPVH